MSRLEDTGQQDRLLPNEHRYNPDPHAHPGLHLIAVVEAVKGSLALIASCPH